MNTLAIVVFGGLGIVALTALVVWAATRRMCPRCGNLGYVVDGRWDAQARFWRAAFVRCPHGCEVTPRGHRERQRYDGEKV